MKTDKKKFGRKYSEKTGVRKEKTLKMANFRPKKDKIRRKK